MQGRSRGDLGEMRAIATARTHAAAEPTVRVRVRLTLTLTPGLEQVGDAVLTELIIRLCNDFPTTEREVHLP